MKQKQKRYGSVISREAVLQRIKRLEREQVITGYTFSLNHNLVDQIYYRVPLLLDISCETRVRDFIAQCYRTPRISRITKFLGDWNYELNIEAKNPTQVREIVSQLMEDNPKLIKNFFSLHIVGRPQTHNNAKLPQPIQAYG